MTLRAQGWRCGEVARRLQGEVRQRPGLSHAFLGVAAMVQVILEAIKKSDGTTRKSITEQVVGGSNQINVPADISAIGKEIKIDPATGDVRTPT